MGSLGAGLWVLTEGIGDQGTGIEGVIVTGCHNLKFRWPAEFQVKE